MKLAGSDGFQNILAQHQIFHVGLRHHHALRAGEALDAADVKEAFDFFVHAADGLNIALLVDGAGHGDVLTQRQAG